MSAGPYHMGKMLLNTSWEETPCERYISTRNGSLGLKLCSTVKASSSASCRPHPPYPPLPPPPPPRSRSAARSHGLSHEVS